MICVGMTFIATMFWSLICFAIYLLLNCDGGMVVRWMVGLVIIGSYRIFTRLISMNAEECKSFLLALVGVAFATLAFFICCYLTFS